ncbi:hypothetical protein ACFL0T_08100 [Candidatus Omnitrophota bacterium]
MGVLFSGILSLILTQINTSVRLSTQAHMEQDRYWVSSHLKRHIHDSAYADISSNPTQIQLYCINSTLIGTYTYQGTTLSYNGDILSNIVNTFVVEDAKNPGNISEIRLLKIDFTIRDEQKPAIKTLSTNLGFLRCERSYNPGTVWNVDKDLYYDHIQEALNAANPGDEIRVMGVCEKYGFNGVFAFDPAWGNTDSVVEITNFVLIKGSYDDSFQTQDTINTPTYIDGNDNKRCIESVTTSGAVKIDGFFIRNGRTIDARGAGIDIDIKNSDATIEISNNTITGNTAESEYGGGINIIPDHGCSVTLDNNIIDGNTTTGGGFGGGIHVRGGWGSGSDVTLTGNTISNNVADGNGKGGGIYAYARTGDTFTFSNNNVITGNSSTTSVGGGMLIIAKGTNASISLRDSTITNNSALNYSGGGVSMGADQGGVISVIGNTISGNYASHSNGGIGASIGYGGPVGGSIIFNNTITNNTAAYGKGGGIGVTAYMDCSVTISNNTINNNSAVGGGGGLYANSQHNGPIELFNNEISNNETEAQGGGVHIWVWDPASPNPSAQGPGIVRLTNNIITENECGEDGDGLKSGRRGGGVYATVQGGSEVTLENNTIDRNKAFNDDGGGAYGRIATEGALTLIRNAITANTAYDDGGGVWASTDTFAATSVELINNTIIGNATTTGDNPGGDGGGVWGHAMVGDAISIINNTITDNTAVSNGSGVYSNAAGVSVKNSIVYPNQVSGNLNVTYSDIGGGASDPSNINSDPLFERNPDPGVDLVWGTPDDDYGDLHLKYDPLALLDPTKTSPCIDAGETTTIPPDSANYFDPPQALSDPPNPSIDLALFPPARGFIKTDMGAYGGNEAGVIGAHTAAADDPNTLFINESVIGTF